MSLSPDLTEVTVMRATVNIAVHREVSADITRRNSQLASTLEVISVPRCLDASRPDCTLILRI